MNAKEKQESSLVGKIIRGIKGNELIIKTQEEVEDEEKKRSEQEENKKRFAKNIRKENRLKKIYSILNKFKFNQDFFIKLFLFLDVVLNVSTILALIFCIYKSIDFLLQENWAMSLTSLGISLVVMYINERIGG